MNSVSSEALRHASSLPVDMDVDDEERRARFRAELDRLVGTAPHGIIRACFVVDLATTEPRWTETEIELRPGDWVTILAVGRARDQRAGTRTQLWMRVGFDGTILRGTGNTHSFLAFESGALQLASPAQRERANQNGAPAPVLDACSSATGHLAIGVLLWHGPTLRGLKQLAGLGELGELVDAEIDRIRNVEPPEGWQYDRLLGSGPI